MKEKKEIMSKLERLDKKGESTRLLPHEVDIKHCLNVWLIQMLREEEIRWYQRSKANNLLQGDNNTKYFHMVVNGKNRKSWIFQLEEGDRIIKGNEPLKSYITDYYKSLFGLSDGGQFFRDNDRRSDIIQISQEDNEKLTTSFTEQEVKEAIFQMKHNKAPGPDGFPVEFYQIFWEIIKGDLMALFKDFYDDKLPLFSLNFGIITLLLKQREATLLLSIFKDFYDDKLPLFSLNFGIITLLLKQREATHIKHFQPICLLNVSLKFFTKVSVNRMTGIATKLINPSQTDLS
jgi:hypothetical protein